MVKHPRKVVWSEKAIKALKAHYDWIALDSKSAANRVKKEQMQAVNDLPSLAEKYQLDEFYLNNKGDVRRFFRWSYRVVYRVSDDSIEVLNIMHTSQEPLV